MQANFPTKIKSALRIHVRQNTELEALFDLNYEEKLEIMLHLLVRHAQEALSKIYSKADAFAKQ